MILTKGQYVKVVFQNSMAMEGIIDSWSDEKSLLIASDGKSSCLIMNTKKDVMLVKITEKLPTHNELVKEATQLEQQFEQVKLEPSSDDLRIKKLANLKKMMIEQDRKIIAEKTRGHITTGQQAVQYGYPTTFRHQ